MVENHSNNMLVKSSNIDKMDINYKKDRMFMLQFFEDYYNENPEGFDVYDCNVNILENKMPIKNK